MILHFFFRRVQQWNYKSQLTRFRRLIFYMFINLAWSPTKVAHYLAHMTLIIKNYSTFAQSLSWPFSMIKTVKLATVFKLVGKDLMAHREVRGETPWPHPRDHWARETLPAQSPETQPNPAGIGPDQPLSTYKPIYEICLSAQLERSNLACPPHRHLPPNFASKHPRQ